MRTANPSLTLLVESVVEPMGYELVGVELVQPGAGATVLRVYIDHERGITLEDCETVSRQLSGVFDVEDPISDNYDLEVSSPGLDRPLFTLQQFERFRGSEARVKLAAKLLGRRNYRGTLAGVDGPTVLMDVDGERVELPFDLIDSARLVPEF
ncbi:MAG: ribosome maturation factor RimP [Thiohalocapsa sp.]|jgi:ribosome maturation factor RimP|nr:ribosome maturation factor RimP [Thiohalocapsa sp.]